MDALTIKLPGSVWDDYLDPQTTNMEAELGLAPPRISKVGFGHRMTYEGVSPEIALELAEYLEDRAGVLIGQDDPANNHIHRAAIRSAQAIRTRLAERETA